jgi:hypothetical protein
MAKRQMRALYAKEKKGEIFHGGSFTMMYHGGKSHLIKSGDGFFGDIFAKVKDIANKAVTVVKQAAPIVSQAVPIIKRIVDVSQGVRNDYPPKARKMIAQYGQGMVSELLIRREPIQSLINSALNLITLGRWGQVKNELNYDKLYHLSAVASVTMPSGQTTRLVIEKNEVINISDNYKMSGKMQYVNIPVQPPIPFATLMENARLNGGASYFIYNAFTANCQMFIMNIVNGNNLNTPAVQSFVLQPLDSLLQKLPDYVSPFAKITTDIAGLANVALEGRGASAITMPAKDYYAEHKHLIELLNDSAKKLRAEADSQAKEVKQRKRGGGRRPVVITSEIPPHRSTLTAAKIEELKRKVDFEDESKAEMYRIIREVLDFLLSDEDFLQNSGDLMTISSAKAELPEDPTKGNPHRWANVIDNILEGLEPVKRGAGFNQALYDKLKAGIKTPEQWQAQQGKRKSKQTYEEYRAKAEKMARDRAYIDDAMMAKAEQGKADAIASQEEYAQRVAENPDLEDVRCKFNANGDQVPAFTTTRGECRANTEVAFRKREERENPANAKFFRPLVEGLTKAGDFAVKYVAPAVGVPKVVTEAYKAFAPPGSEFYKGQGKKMRGGAGNAANLKRAYEGFERVISNLFSIAGGDVPMNRVYDALSRLNRQYYNTLDLIADATVPRGMFEARDRTTAEYVASDNLKRELVNTFINNWIVELEDVILDYPQFPGLADVMSADTNDLIRGRLREAQVRAQELAAAQEGRRQEAARVEGMRVREEATRRAEARASRRENPIAYMSEDNPSFVFIPESDLPEPEQEGSGLPRNYLAILKRKAKAKGYDPKALRLATDGKHKVEILVGEKVVKFGKHGMADFEIYKIMEREKKIPKGTAKKHQEDYLKRSAKIRGNWRDNKFSPNSLARAILW